MTSAGSPMKNAAPCRYFTSSGSCLHGKDCQFLHENPQIQKVSQPASTKASNGNDAQEVTGPDGSNGDQFFNATFNPNGLSDFPPFPSRPKASRSPLGVIAGGGTTNAPNMQNSPNKASSEDSAGLADQFSGMTMASKLQASLKDQATPATAQLTPQKQVFPLPPFQVA